MEFATLVISTLILWLSAVREDHRGSVQILAAFLTLLTGFSLFMATV